jgi:hypothetical protein
MIKLIYVFKINFRINTKSTKKLGFHNFKKKINLTTKNKTQNMNKTKFKNR